jgi:hypothetical protein
VRGERVVFADAVRGWVMRMWRFGWCAAVVASFAWGCGANATVGTNAGAGGIVKALARRLETVVVAAQTREVTSRHEFVHITIEFDAMMVGKLEGFRLECPGLACTSEESPCVPMEWVPEDALTSSKMWWDKFRLQGLVHEGRSVNVFLQKPPTLQHIENCTIYGTHHSSDRAVVSVETDVEKRLVLIHNGTRPGGVQSIGQQASNDPFFKNALKNMSFMEAKEFVPKEGHPCFHEVVGFTNCVKEKQHVRFCDDEKLALSKCRYIAAREKGGGREIKNAFSFRACSGAGAGCGPAPVQAGAPVGELAGKLELPPPPPDSPGGEDQSDAAGVITQSIVHTVMGSLVPQTVDNFANKAQEELPKVLTVSLINGIPGNGNVDGVGGEGQPTKGLGPGEFEMAFKQVFPTEKDFVRKKKQRELKPDRKAPMTELEDEAKKNVENADKALDKANIELKNLRSALPRLKNDVAETLKTAKQYAGQAQGAKDEFHKKLETKKAKMVQTEAIRKLELVAQTADAVKLASKKSADAAVLAAAAKLKLRRIRREKEDKKTRKARDKNDANEYVPLFRWRRWKKRKIHINKFLVKPNKTIEEYRSAALVTSKLLATYTELSQSFLADKLYKETLSSLTEAERAATVAYLELKTCRDLLKKGMQHAVFANTSRAGNVSHALRHGPIEMRFKSASTSSHEMTQLLPIFEPPVDEAQNSYGRRFPVPLLKHAKAISDLEQQTRTVMMDHAEAQNVVTRLIEQCNVEKRPLEVAKENMDGALREVAKQLVAFHVSFDRQTGSEKRGKELPPEVIHNIKRVRVFCEAILEEVKDICKYSIEDALDMAKLSWIKSRLIEIENARDHRSYKTQMAEYMGNVYENALKEARKPLDTPLPTSPVPRRAPRPTITSPVVKQVKAVKVPPAPRVYKRPGKLTKLDDVEDHCKDSHCEPAGRVMEKKTSLLEMSGRPMPLGERTGLGALPKAITGELIHTLSSFFINEVAAEFTYAMTPGIAASVLNSVKRESLNYVSRRVQRILGDLVKQTTQMTIPTTLNALLPPQMLEALQFSATHVLTRSVTHAVTPTLIYSLGTPVKTLHKITGECQRDLRGKACQDARRKLSKKTSWADFYSAYFSDYYATFYTDQRQLENTVPSLNQDYTGKMERDDWGEEGEVPTVERALKID